MGRKLNQPKVLNPPERIFLNVGDLDEDCEFSDLSTENITWSSDDSIFESDVEYCLIKRRRKRP